MTDTATTTPVKKVFDADSLAKIVDQSFGDIPADHRNVAVAWVTTDGTLRATVARRVTGARGDWKMGATFGRDVATGFYGGGFVKGSW